MIIVTFYEEHTGEINSFSSVSDEQMANLVAASRELGYIVGRPPAEDCYVEAGAFVQMPARPDQHHVFDYATKTWADPRGLEDLRAARLVDVDVWFEERAAALTAGYPSTERLTWPTQQAEALAWGADSAAPTPYLDGLAAARQISPQDMRQRTLEAVQLFMGASQFLVGTRQRLRDAAMAAETLQDLQDLQDLQAVQWPEEQP